jgi:hypothetical protein
MKKGFIKKVKDVLKAEQGTETFKSIERWFNLIPEVESFSKDWIIIPTSASIECQQIFRFLIKNKKEKNENATVSIALRYQTSKHYAPEPPTWDIWSHKKSRDYHCFMENTDELVNLINTALDMSVEDYSNDYE